MPVGAVCPTAHNGRGEGEGMRAATRRRVNRVVVNRQMCHKNLSRRRPCRGHKPKASRTDPVAGEAYAEGGRGAP